MTFAVSESNTRRWRSFFAERWVFREFSFSTAVCRKYTWKSWQHIFKSRFFYWNCRWYRHELQPVEHEMAMFVRCINRHLETKRNLRSWGIQCWILTHVSWRRIGSMLPNALRRHTWEFVGVAVGSWGGFLRKIPFKESHQKRILVVKNHVWEGVGFEDLEHGSVTNDMAWPSRGWFNYSNISPCFCPVFSNGSILWSSKTWCSYVFIPNRRPCLLLKPLGSTSAPPRGPQVHLANQGAENVSKNFEHFGNLEVVWSRPQLIKQGIEPCPLPIRFYDLGA